MDGDRLWNSGVYWLQKIAIRKGVRGTMKRSPAAPLGGANGGERIGAATLGTNIIARGRASRYPTQFGGEPFKVKPKLPDDIVQISDSQ